MKEQLAQAFMPLALKMVAINKVKDSLASRYT